DLHKVVVIICWRPSPAASHPLERLSLVARRWLKEQRLARQGAVEKGFLSPIGLDENLVAHPAKQEVDLKARFLNVRKHRFGEWAVGPRTIISRRTVLGSVGHEHAAFGFDRR